MGGHLSHEYHYVTSIGEQKLQTCSACGETTIDTTGIDEEESDCPSCHAKEAKKNSGIEVSASVVEFPLCFFIEKINFVQIILLLAWQKKKFTLFENKRSFFVDLVSIFMEFLFFLSDLKKNIF